MLDKIDRAILLLLQEDADMRIHQMEKHTRIPRSTIHHRIQKLKKHGTIKQVRAIVEPSHIGLTVCALVHVVVSNRQGVHEIAQRLGGQPNVEEVHITAGVFDIVAKVRFKDNAALANFIFNDKTGIKVWEGVQRTESMICLESPREEGVLEVQ